MAKKEKNVQEPISMGLYRQLVYECAAMLMESDCDKEQVIHRLLDLADRSICPENVASEETAKEKASAPVPKVKVIIRDGVATSALADSQVDLEIVDIDKDYSDYDQLMEYEAQLYQDESLKCIEFITANFEEDEGE